MEALSATEIFGFLSLLSMIQPLAFGNDLGAKFLSRDFVAPIAERHFGEFGMLPL